MSSQLRFLVVLAVLSLATSVVAGQPIYGPPRLATQTVLPVDVGDLGSNGAQQDYCGPVYEALVPGSGYVPLSATSPFTGLAITEYADDCHLTAGGALCSFTIGYYEPEDVTVDFTITIHANAPDDGTFGAILAGPYTFPGLPAGFNQLTLIPPDNPTLPKDVWFSVTATPLSAGLVISGGPPTVGASHDYLLDVPALSLFFYDGDPVANFMISIEVEPTVPTEAVSWGKVKSLYQ